jgi:hypothetical protein
VEENIHDLVSTLYEYMIFEFFSLFKTKRSVLCKDRQYVLDRSLEVNDIRADGKGEMIFRMQWFVVKQWQGVRQYALRLLVE